MNAMNPTSFRPEPHRHRFTIANARKLVEIGVLDPEARFEILDGEIIDMPSEGKAHRDYKVELTRFFNRVLPDALCAGPDATMPLSKNDGPEPDLYIYRAGSSYEPIPPQDILLVVEISDSSLGYDLGRKAGKYASYGIAEYWVVDLTSSRTHVLRKPDDGAYHEITAVAFDAELAPERISGVRLRISELPNLD